MVAALSLFLGIVSIRETLQACSGPAPLTSTVDSLSQGLHRGCFAESGASADWPAADQAGASPDALGLLQRLSSRGSGTLRGKRGADRTDDAKGEQTKPTLSASSQSGSAGVQSAIMKLLEQEGEQTDMISTLLAENRVIMQKMHDYEQELNDTRKELINTKALAMSAGHESREAKDLADHADHAADNAAAAAHDAATAAETAGQKNDFTFRLPGVSWFMSDAPAEKKDNASLAAPTAQLASFPVNDTVENSAQSHTAEAQTLTQGSAETVAVAPQTAPHSAEVDGADAKTGTQLDPVAKLVAQAQMAAPSLAQPSADGRAKSATVTAGTAAAAAQQAALTAASVVQSSTQGKQEGVFNTSLAVGPATDVQSVAKVEATEHAPFAQPDVALKQSPPIQAPTEPQMDISTAVPSIPENQPSAPGRAQAAALAAATAASAAQRAAAAAASAVQSAREKQVQERMVSEISAQPSTMQGAQSNAAEINAVATQTGTVTPGSPMGESNIQSHTQTNMVEQTQSAMQASASGRAEAAALAAETAATAAQKAAAAVASAVQSARGGQVQERVVSANPAIPPTAADAQIMQASSGRAEAAALAAETAATAAQQAAAVAVSAVHSAREEQVQKRVVNADPAAFPTSQGAETILPKIAVKDVQSAVKATVNQEASAAQHGMGVQGSPRGSNDAESQMQTGVVVNTPSTMQTSESGRAEAAAVAAENAAAAAQDAAAVAAASVAQSVQQPHQAVATAPAAVLAMQGTETSPAAHSVAKMPAAMQSAGASQAAAQEQIAGLVHATQDVQPTATDPALTVATPGATASHPAEAVVVPPEKAAPSRQASASELGERAAEAAETAAAAAAAAQSAAVAAASAAQSAAVAANAPH
mmetsp:Transcript_85823/g.151464  ORF Transcript_85823/g.151464 Transcript_85823/m.151464 type:complete len:879 (+) Transcript_85823:105-2741(+)